MKNGFTALKDWVVDIAPIELVCGEKILWGNLCSPTTCGHTGCYEGFCILSQEVGSPPIG